MGNTYKNSIEEEELTQAKKGLFTTINNTFKMDEMFSGGVPVQLLPKIVWISILIILYIANAHYTEKTIRKIDKLKFDVEELRTEYITIKSAYMTGSKQSEIAKQVAILGLEESKKPPIIIIDDL